MKIKAIKGINNRLALIFTPMSATKMVAGKATFKMMFFIPLTCSLPLNFFFSKKPMAIRRSKVNVLAKAESVLIDLNKITNQFLTNHLAECIYK